MQMPDTGEWTITNLAHKDWVLVILDASFHVADFEAATDTLVES